MASRLIVCNENGISVDGLRYLVKKKTSHISKTKRRIDAFIKMTSSVGGLKNSGLFQHKDDTVEKLMTANEC